MTKVLTKVGLEALKRPGRYRDGAGRRALCSGDGGARRDPRRSFLYRYTINRRCREMGLGSYPGVGLAEAREKARGGSYAAREGARSLGRGAEGQGGPPTAQTFAEATKAYLDHLAAQHADTKCRG